MPAKHPWTRWGLPAPKSEASGGELSLVDYEVYSGLVVRGWPFFVRLDGWAFHSLTKRLNLKKPFDLRLVKFLVRAAKELFLPFNPVLCYIFSDEASFLFVEPTVFRRIEKIDSVLASSFASRFSILMKSPAAFDCRVIPVGRRNVRRYLIWRQAECLRNHYNAWAQWALINRAGLSPRSANERLTGLKVPELSKLCKQYGINLERTPAWQRMGVVLYFEDYPKRGYNPITKNFVVANRRRVKIEWKAPSFDAKEGLKLVRTVLAR
ncbi:MAG: tRNA 5'-guanylyltransferase [Thaumarchaeota archaeon]|nr:tRNA 5'-guanylyltransferase [Nitrososphaerota archaeon]